MNADYFGADDSGQHSVGEQRSFYPSLRLDSSHIVSFSFASLRSLAFVQRDADEPAAD